MKAYEFPVRIMSGGTIRLPDALSEKLHKNQHVRVIVLVNESEDGEEREDWNRLTTEQFFAGYAAKEPDFSGLPEEMAEVVAACPNRDSQG